MEHLLSKPLNPLPFLAVRRLLGLIKSTIVVLYWVSITEFYVYCLSYQLLNTRPNNAGFANNNVSASGHAFPSTH